MTTKKELGEKKTLKILLKGNTATGKTYIACQIAKKVAELGKTVQYVDNQKGSADELDNFDDNILEHINYDYTPEFDDMYKCMQKPAFLTIIDDLGLLQMLARRRSTAAFIKQGYYYMGTEKGGGIGKIPIDNPDLFHLQGYMYANPNRREENFLMDFIEQNHIIGTIMTYEIGKELGRVVDGWFGIIMNLKVTMEKNPDTGKREPVYYGTLVKDRGETFRKQNDDVDIGVDVSNPHKRLIKLFENKEVL